MNNIYSVLQINNHIKSLLLKDKVLSDVRIKGEISNFKSHSSGHLYFSLKESGSILRCVMFKSAASALNFRPEEGISVVAGGFISVFERDGQYQLYVNSMLPDGAGQYYLAFEKLKAKLNAEGLFNEAVKKRIPSLPMTIGLITSPTGAVIRDMLNVISRRFPDVTIRIKPVSVQGKGAEKEICEAVRYFGRTRSADVLIIARGGGSIEDLWAFNDEELARTIRASSIPVISAIGHETDFTIADFAADLRAPTPSAAAELVVPVKKDVYIYLSNSKARLLNAINRKMEMSGRIFERLSSSSFLKRPLHRVENERMKLDFIIQKLENIMKIKQKNAVSLHTVLASKLAALDPEAILDRGYSIVRNAEDGKIIKSITSVAVGQKLEIDLKDGKVATEVESLF